MPDSERHLSARRNDTPPDGDNKKIPEHCPELTQEVKQADIPVLDQALTAALLQDNIPVLEETIPEFEKNIPTLDEEAAPIGLDDPRPGRHG